MNPDPASLDNLRDIAELPAVSWLPLAPGWWCVCGLVLIVTAYFSFRAWRLWKANAYRRAALNELGVASDISTIAEILKRTALAACPRAQVAALTGTSWCEWLEKTGGLQMPDSVRSALTNGVFGANFTVNLPEVAAFSAAWVSNHRFHHPPGSSHEQDSAASSAPYEKGRIAC